MRQFGASIQNIGRKAFTAGLGGVAAFALPMKQMMNFDDAIRMTGAVSQSTAVELESLRQTALELGRTTSFTAVEVAGLMGELGRAGFKPDQINEMTGAVLNLARASGTDAVLASGIMAATIRQFSLGATDATRVANVLTLAANSTFNSVESLGEAMSYAGPVAASMGMSLEDTVALLGTLGNVGIQGSNAGTAVRRLVTMTAADAAKMKEIFGVSFLDAAGNIRPLVTVMGELATATNNLPSGERAAKFNEAFGLLGITSANVIAATAADTQVLADQLKNVGGVAAETAQKMDAGAGGAFRILTSAVEGASIAIGTALAPQFIKLAEWITQTTGTLTEWITRNEGMIVSVAKGTAYVLAGGAALIAIGKAFTVAAVGAKILAAAVTILTTPMLVIPGILLGIGGYLSYTNGMFTSLSETLTGTFGGAWDLIVKKVGSGDLAGAMKFAWELAQQTFQLGIAYVQQAWGGFTDWISSSVQSFGAVVGEMWGVLWDSLTSTASLAWAGIKDAFQDVVDWANRLVGRNVPERKTNADQVIEANAKRAEERAQFNMDAEKELQAMLAAGQAERQSAVDAQLAKIQELIATEKKRTEIQEAGTLAVAAAPVPPPVQRMVETLIQGSAAGARISQFASEAVNKATVEGQAIAFAALDQREKKDETKDAVVSLESTLVDEFERTRRQDRDAPRLAGSRKG